MIEHYDLLVIGSGPGGQRAAIQAAKLGKRVAVVEKSDQLGGAGLRAGTIPTKALREAALALSGVAGSGLLTNKRLIRRNVTINELTAVTRDVVTTQLHVLEDAFAAIILRWCGDRRALKTRTRFSSRERTESGR